MSLVNKLLIGAGFFTGCAIFILFVISGQYLYYGSDAYYYLAMADSMLATGQLMDITRVAAVPPQTIQNALPLLIAVIKSVFHPDQYQSLIIISCINYVLWIFAAVPFNKIIRLIGITGDFARSVMIAGFLGSGLLLVAQIGPTTDGIFNAGAILLLYLLLNVFSIDKDRDSKSVILQWLLIFFLEAVLIHFSIRITAFIVASLFPAILLYKSQHRVNLLGASLSALGAFASLYTGLQFIDQSYITSFARDFFQHNIHYSLFVGPVIVNLHTQLWLPIIAQFLLLTLIAFLAYCLYRGIQQNDPFLVMLPPTIFIFFIYILSLPTESIILSAGPRYAILTLPLLWLLLSRFKIGKSLMFLLVGVSLIFGMLTARTYYKSINTEKFFTYLRYKQLALPKSEYLISQYPRHSYVLISGQNINDNFCDITVRTDDALWILGSAEYRNQKINEFLACHNLEIESERFVTSDYYAKDNSGIVVYRFKNI